MREYNHKQIEEKWRKRWVELKLHLTEEDTQKPKCYILDEFPYPSGEGLHTGHTRIYTASDIYARMKRMQGFNVLHPSGWDAFGLPAEQFAIKHKVHPSISVKKNTERYKEQMERIGLSYDWEREINTTDPEFYRWTQWIFLELYKKGLAFESFEPINWCPTCQTGLANEDLEGGNCERCGTAVIKKPMRQWVLRITKYADRLIDDLETLSEWPDAVKEAQRNWIGRSEGAEIQFLVSSLQSLGKFPIQHLTVFTTRPDTLFGVTFLAISAEAANQLPAPTINISPDIYYPFDEILYLEGRADSASNVEIQFQKQGVKPLKFNVKSDINPNSIIAEKNNEKEPNNEVVLMKLSSPDFKHNAMMPSELTCDGDDTSPELNIADVPKNAKSGLLFFVMCFLGRFVGNMLGSIIRIRYISFL